MSLRHLTAAERALVEAARKDADSADKLLAMVAEAFVRARKQSRVALTPRNLTPTQIDLIRRGLGSSADTVRAAFTDEDLARMVQSTARWWLREYTTKALTIGRYSRQVAIAQPLNRAAASLVVIDVSKALAATTDAKDVQRAAEQTREWSGAASDGAKKALASMEVLDAHHIVEKQWLTQFKDAFATVGWDSEDAMDAILIPVATHDRGLKGLVKALGVEDTLAKGLEYESVSSLLERRIVTPENFLKLLPADRPLAFVVEPGVTKASQVVRKHLEVYDSDPGISRSLRSPGPDGKPAGSVAQSELGRRLIEIAGKLEEFEKKPPGP